MSDTENKTPANRPTLGTKNKAITLTLNPKAKLEEQHTIVVLGVERGGTSMIAGVLRAIGVCMGERAGLNHEDPKFITDDKDKLEAHIAYRNRTKDVWGFKMPKASLSLDFYEKKLRKPLFIVAYRNPLSIADSWMQRGAGDAQGVLTRIETYQNALNALFARTRRPVMLVNYERAVAESDARSEFVSQIADFIGMSLDSETHQRGMDMMTGDGGGYVNLPEHFFHVSEADNMAKGQRLEVNAQGPDPRDEDGWVSHERMPPKLIYQTSTGDNFPKHFRMRINIQEHKPDTVLGGKLRLCFRYTDTFTNAHCALPKLKEGMNILDIETSGQADAIAFMPFKVPCKFKMETHFELMPDVAEDPNTPESSADNTTTAELRKRTKRTFWSRLTGS